MSMIDLLFPVLGTSLPTDHLYLLYAALSRRIPAFHDLSHPLRFAAINGQLAERGRIALFDRSRLRLRLTTEHIPQVLPLAGQSFVVGGDRLRLGVPFVSALVPAPGLLA